MPFLAEPHQWRSLHTSLEYQKKAQKIEKVEEFITKELFPKLNRKLSMHN